MEQVVTRRPGAAVPPRPVARPAIAAEHLTWLTRILAAAASGSATGPSGELREVCEQLGASLGPPRVIRNAEAEPYLSRYYLIGGPLDGNRAWDAHGDPRPGTKWAELPTNLYLHHLHCSDERGRLHSHPWESAVSLILAGGYREDRRDGDQVATRTVDPLELNVLRADDFHRIDLADGDAWSFFVTGRPIGSWYFWDPETQQTTRAGAAARAAAREPVSSAADLFS